MRFARLTYAAPTQVNCRKAAPPKMIPKMKISSPARFTAFAFSAPRSNHQSHQISNNYNYPVAGQPGYGIAQGSIFSIFGTNLANSSTDLQHAPLPATLAGVSAKVTVNGVSTRRSCIT